MEQQNAVTLIVSVLTILAMCFLAGGFVGTAQAQAGSGPVDVNASDLPGDGTQSDPYEISNVSELQAMEDDVDAYYILENDIDASATTDWNGGSGFTPISRFNGTLNGTGNVIDGLHSENRGGVFSTVEENGAVIRVHLRDVNVTDDYNVGGLVGGTNYGTIRNTSVSGTVTGDGTVVGGLAASNAGLIVGSNVSGSVTGTFQVGGVAGDIDKGGVIKDSYATGDITAKNNNVGGIAGNNGGVIENSFSTSTVSGNLTDGFNAGGLVGINGKTNTDGTVRVSYATGSVEGDTYVGGLVGRNFNGTVEESYAAGSVEGNSGVGGLVGRSDGTIVGSYWDTEATGQPTSAGASTGLATAQMEADAAQTSMERFDFEAIWTTTGSYPTLRGLPNPSTQDEQSVASIIAPPDDSYSPSAPFTVGTFHNATGTIDSGDVAIRLVNATADNGTVVALKHAAPITGGVNTTIPAGSLTGDVTVAVQLYNLSSQQVVTSDRVNLTAETSTERRVEYGLAVAIGDSSLSPRANGMALDVAISGGAVEIGGTETAVVEIQRPSTGASLSVTPNTTTRYNVTGFDTQNLYDADGSIKSSTDAQLSILTESGEFTEINVTISGDRNIFTQSTFARYVVAVETAQGTVIGETEPGLRGIGYPGQLTQNATAGTIEVTFPRLSSVNNSWYVEYQVTDSDGNTVISKPVANRNRADNFTVTVDSGRLAEGTYDQDLIIKQTEADPTSQRILRIFGNFDDGLQISDGRTNDVEQPGTSVTFTNQTIENGSNTVTVASTNLTEGGFVVIHDANLTEGTGAVPSAIGASAFLPAGTNENITITLERPVTGNETLIAMAHQDTNNNEAYDFVTSSGQTDAAYRINGSAVTDSASITTQSGGTTPVDEYGNQMGQVDTTGLLDAIADWRGDDLTVEQLLEVIAQWRTDN